MKQDSCAEPCNNIIELANIFKNGSEKKSCEDGLKKLTDLIPAIQLESEKSWRRMGAELWISQMLGDCGFNAESKQWSESAKSLAQNIYHPDSEGMLLFKSNF